MAWKIYALEGEWSFDLRDNSSVRDLLGVLAHNDAKVGVILRDVATADDLEHYVGRWGAARYRDFRIGYFALHGAPGRLVFRGSKVPIGEIAERLEGSCKGKIVCFSSCSVARDRKQLERFKKLTGARTVCGYRKDVDWTAAAAFDLLLLHGLVFYESFPKAER